MNIQIGRVGQSYLNAHYVGRPGKGQRSALGNPYKPSARTAEAHTVVCAQYRKWLWDRIQQRDRAVCEELRLLLHKARSEMGVTLVCFCIPLPCHAEVIKRCLLWLDSNEQVLD